MGYYKNLSIDIENMVEEAGVYTVLMGLIQYCKTEAEDAARNNCHKTAANWIIREGILRRAVKRFRAKHLDE